MAGWCLRAERLRYRRSAAHVAGLSVAIGYVPKEIADEVEGWSIEILGEILPACLRAEPLFDAGRTRMRG